MYLLNNLFGIQELIRNLVSGTGCSGYSLLFLAGTVPSSAIQIQKAANRCILQEAFSIDFHMFMLSNFSFNVGFVPSQQSNSTSKLFSEQPCWTRAHWTLFNIVYRREKQSHQISNQIWNWFQNIFSGSTIHVFQIYGHEWASEKNVKSTIIYPKTAWLSWTTGTNKMWIPSRRKHCS